MSVCVTIRTKNILQPDVYLKCLADKGEQIVGKGTHAPMITTEELQMAIPSFDWTGGHSGRLLSQEDAQKLETIWAGFLKKNEDRIDGEIFNVNRHVTFDNL